MSIDTRIEAIRLLSDGHWHSGQDLARVLGISRAAVWQRLQALAEWGLELHAVRGRGYRLAQPLELLDVTEIRRHLSADACQRLASIDLYPVLDSTNAWLMVQPGDGEARLCLAEYQTAGRGRRGRDWRSPFGANLYLSLAWHFAEMPSKFSALGLVIGVSLAEALAALGASGVGLKWPNDLLWQGRKLAGILIEHRGEGGGPARVVVGVGLNLSMTAAQAENIGQPWTTLAEVLHADSRELPGRNVLSASIVDALVRALDEFSAQGFTDIARRWMKHDLTEGKSVNLEHDGQVISGIARGIDDDGALLLEVAGRTQRFLSGDLSLRLASGAT
ncbi:MAG: bifunctional biotin--[acetyl-CoA-carboxylase] ligase/biotin operon repressor BirA [Nevskiales bacterium]